MDNGYGCAASPMYVAEFYLGIFVWGAMGVKARV